jgi:hypothetical protein
MINRRRFLKGIGGVTVALPALSLFSKKGEAQTTDPIRRAVFFWTPNGFNLSTFYPRTRFNGGASAFGPLNSDAFVPRPLDTSTALTNGVPRAIFRHPEWGLRNLGSFSSRLSVLRGFRNSRMGFVDLAAGGDHGMNTANRLTAAGIGTGPGYALGRSIDYAIAERINPLIDGVRDPLVLHVGSNTDPRNGEGTSFVSYRGPEDPDPGINNPWVAYRRLMGISSGSPAENYLVTRKRRVADLVRAELTEIQASTPLGGPDRRLLTDWLGLVEATEDQMQNMNLMCTTEARDALLPESAARGWEGRTNDELGRYENFAGIGDAMLKIIALSLLCDHTRVATIQWSGGAGGPAFGAMGLNSTDAGAGNWHAGERHHELSHRNGSDGDEPGFLPDVERNMSWIDQWYGDRYRDLISLLDGFQMLDDSVVMWVPEFGDGRAHHFLEITAVLAGSATGYLRTGEMFDCSPNQSWNTRLDNETNGPAIRPADNPANVYSLDIGWIDNTTSHNKLLTTVFNAVLPRDANGQPINALTRFPEADTADVHNTIETGEVDRIRT